MKTKQIFTALTVLFTLLFASISHAADITATNSGSWGDTNIWDSGTVPGTNDDIDVEAPFNVTVDTNAAIQYIYGGGTVTMAPNSILNVVGDPAGAFGTATLGLLDTTAPGNTVIYSGNAYFAKHQNYNNLVFSGYGSFYNGDIGNGAVNMTIAGNMSTAGTASVQAGADITIGGNLILGTNTSFDCSVSRITVQSNTIVSGFLLDGDGSLTNPSGEIETNNFLGNVTINPSGTWIVSDVTTWSVGGSFTNYGIIKSTGFGSISFDGTGNIAGNAFQIKTMTINGTYTIGATITLATNTPTLNGTLVFDLANTNQIILNAGTNWLYYSGILDVINSGAAPVAGNSYKLFNAPNYGGSFTSTSFASLPSGLNWVDNLATSGSIAVTGSSAGSPIITLSRSGNLLTLSWASTTFPGYSVQAQTNSAGIRTNWSATGSGTVSPFSIAINPTNPPVFFRLSNP